MSQQRARQEDTSGPTGTGCIRCGKRKHVQGIQSDRRSVYLQGTSVLYGGGHPRNGMDSHRRPRMSTMSKDTGGNPEKGSCSLSTEIGMSSRHPYSFLCLQKQTMNYEIHNSILKRAISFLMNQRKTFEGFHSLLT